MVYAENEGEVFLGRSVTKTTNMSEETMQKVDAEIRRIIDEQYAIARKLIEDNQDKMHAMAKALLEWETIDAEQIDDIMYGKPPRPPKDWTPAPVKPAGGVPPVTPGQRARGGVIASATRIATTGLRPRFPLPCHASGRPARFDDRPRRAAGDGHRQRHARLVLRRRPGADAGAAPSRTCERLLAEGADILDLGGESSRPGAEPVDAGDELARVLPVLREARDARLPGLGRHRQARGDARRARPRRRHRQRHRRAARAGRAARRWRRIRPAASA